MTNQILQGILVVCEGRPFFKEHLSVITEITAKHDFSLLFEPGITIEKISEYAKDKVEARCNIFLLGNYSALDIAVNNPGLVRGLILTEHTSICDIMDKVYNKAEEFPCQLSGLFFQNQQADLWEKRNKVFAPKQTICKREQANWRKRIEINRTGEKLERGSTYLAKMEDFNIALGVFIEEAMIAPLVRQDITQDHKEISARLEQVNIKGWGKEPS